TIALVEPRKAAPAPPAKEDLPPMKYLVNWDPRYYPGPKGDPDPPKPPERSPVAIRFGAATWAERAASDWLTFGLSVEIGVRYRAFSLSAETHGDPSLGSQTIPYVGPIRFARVSAALLLCWHLELAVSAEGL